MFNEALTRNAAAFTRFFEALRFCHGAMLNYSAIARDCGVSAKTVRIYFEILEDTLVGHLIRPFHRRTGRQSITAAPKFFLFDVGVASHICGRVLTEPRGTAFGAAFEHFLLQEILAARSYRGADWPIEYWRTKSGLEVDFVLNRGEIALEAETSVRPGDLRPINAFVDEFSPRRAIVVTAKDPPRRIGAIDIMPYAEFLDMLHGGHLL